MYVFSLHFSFTEIFKKGTKKEIHSKYRSVVKTVKKYPGKIIEDNINEEKR